MLRSSELYGSTRARLVSRRVARVAVEGLGNPSLGLPRWLVALAAAPPDPVLEPRSGRARFAGVRDRRRGRVRRRRRGLGRAWSLRARPVERLLLPRAPGRRPRRAPPPPRDHHGRQRAMGRAPPPVRQRRPRARRGRPPRGCAMLRRVGGVPALTVYAFSHENWKRGRDEVDHPMAPLERTLVAELPRSRPRGRARHRHGRRRHAHPKSTRCRATRRGRHPRQRETQAERRPLVLCEARRSSPPPED